MFYIDRYLLVTVASDIVSRVDAIDAAAQDLDAKIAALDADAHKIQSGAQSVADSLTGPPASGAGAGAGEASGPPTGDVEPPGDEADGPAPEIWEIGAGVVVVGVCWEARLRA